MLNQERKIAALNAAYAAHIEKLFEVLCANLGTDTKDAQPRFKRGVTIADQAYDAATKVLE